MAKLIYIADDEPDICLMMKTFLENEGFEVECFADGAALRRAVGERMPDMLILDVMMPGEDGLSLCSSFRSESSVPIMIVSAKDSPLDRAAGIILGSDDYITKPFLPLELIARVKALFRRSELANASADDRYQCGNLSLCRGSRRILIGGEPFFVTPLEFDFLLYLIQHGGAAVPKDGILEQVWKKRGITEEQKTPEELVKRLRRKMKARNATAMVETVWGYGYRLAEKDELQPGG